MISTESIDRLYTGDPETQEHERKGQMIRLIGPSLAGQHGVLDRIVTDWRTHEGKVAGDYLRRRIGILPETDPVYQLTLASGTQAGKAIWIHESEIGGVYNGKRLNALGPEYQSRFADHERYKYLGDPTYCPFSNCESDNIQTLGMSISGPSYKVKRICLDCEGTWKEVLTVMGLE